LKLAITLGSWILDKQSDWLEHWDWCVTSDGQFLYLRHGPSLWHRFLWRPNSHNSYFGDFLVEDSPPEPLLRATVEGDVETIYLLNSSAHAQHSIHEVTIPESIQLRGLQIMAPAVTWVTKYLRTSPSIQHLVNDIANGTAVAVCRNTRH